MVQIPRVAGGTAVNRRLGRGADAAFGAKVLAPALVADGGDAVEALAAMVPGGPRQRLGTRLFKRRLL